jgi:hypothetical protein
MMTVIATAKRQGRNVLKFLAALVSLPPGKAARTFYARP